MFNCSQCGACCKEIHKSSLVPKAMLDERGWCIHLKDDNSCAIYHNRPWFCKIDDLYETYFSEQYSLLDYYNANAIICNELQNKQGLDKLFRIKLI